MSIFSHTTRKDASQIGKIKLPSKSRLYSFGITEHMEPATEYSNDLSISKTWPLDSKTHFWCRTSIDSPILLPMQEYACNEIGIRFR
jgi:hypothetical protein